MSAINISGLGKAYRQYPNRWSRLVEWFSPVGKIRHKLKWIIRDVDFVVEPGEAVGIVGVNGAGKSTLLKIITGTIQPTVGSVSMNGRVAPLLELGIGFHPDFSGRQNVLMAGQLLGYSTKEIINLMSEIENFAEIDGYLDLPVRIYSSGMQVRLAFSLATAIRPDILIVDEALSVGDAYFQHKCFERIRKFLSEGTTLLFVSHDLAAVRSLCSKCLWLENGSGKFFGETKNVLDEYSKSIYGKNQKVEKQTREANKALISFEVQAPVPRDCRQSLVNNSNFRNNLEILPLFNGEEWGDGLAKITRVSLSARGGEALGWILGGEDVTLQIEAVALKNLSNVFIGFQVRDRLGQILFGDNTYLSTLDDPVTLSTNQSIRVSFEFRMPIFPKGTYSISSAITSGSQSSHIVHAWCDEALYFESQNANSVSGLVGVPMTKISIENTQFKDK